MSDSTLSPETDLHMQELAQRSGHMQDERPLVAFLYLLMRDVVSTGQVEELLLRLRLADHRDQHDFTAHSFTNGYLARYAQDIADRLTPA